MKFNFKLYLMVMPVALLLISCGKKNNSSDFSAPGSGTASNPVSLPTPTPGGPTPTPFANSVCVNPSPSTAQSPLYNFSVSGYSTDTVTTGAANIIADQTLRIRLTPGPAGLNRGSTAKTNDYDSMSFTVSIVNASGAVVGTKTISSTQTVLFPSLTIGGSTVAKNYSAGIPINSPSQILVFSGLYGGPYQVRISNVKTNYPCKTVTATSGQYQCGQVQAYDASGRCYTSFYYAPWGSWLYGYGVANKDFLTSNYTCCLDGTLYEQFQNARCGVGAPFTNDNWTFSLIEVETETTACLN